MSNAKAGDTVKIHYTGTLDDGTQFDSSTGREPLQFELGSGQVIPGFDKAVEGMTVGDQKTVNILLMEWESGRSILYVHFMRCRFRRMRLCRMTVIYQSILSIHLRINLQ